MLTDDPTLVKHTTARAIVNYAKAHHIRLVRHITLQREPDDTIVACAAGVLGLIEATVAADVYDLGPARLDEALTETEADEPFYTTYYLNALQDAFDGVHYVAPYRHAGRPYEVAANDEYALGYATGTEAFELAKTEGVFDATPHRQRFEED